MTALLTEAVTEKPLVPITRTHNGTLTIVSNKTGDHRTVRIHTQPKDAKFAPGERVVGLLSGSDNESDYRSFGWMKPEGCVLFRNKQDSELFQWLCKFLNNPLPHCAKVDVLWEGRCRVCNRKLTTPESIRSGIGPVCKGRE